MPHDRRDPGQGRSGARVDAIAAWMLCVVMVSGCQESANEASPGTSFPEPMSEADESRFEAEREMLINQLASRGIVDPEVLRAMRAVPRHRFVPARLQRRAYEDRPLSIGLEQTISQPFIVAMMTEALELRSRSRVLEVGTGSGYQAAVLAEITPHVYSIEILAPLAEQAQRNLEDAGYPDVHCRVGDGYYGWPEEAPFDAIVVTAAPGFVPPKLKEQLAVGGRLCIPVGEEGVVQRLMLLTRMGDGEIREEMLELVRFVPMTGAVRDG